MYLTLTHGEKSGDLILSFASLSFPPQTHIFFYPLSWSAARTRPHLTSWIIWHPRKRTTVAWGNISGLWRWCHASLTWVSSTFNFFNLILDSVFHLLVFIKKWPPQKTMCADVVCLCPSQWKITWVTFESTKKIKMAEVNMSSCQFWNLLQSCSIIFPQKHTPNVFRVTHWYHSAIYLFIYFVCYLLSCIEECCVLQHTVWPNEFKWFICLFFHWLLPLCSYVSCLSIFCLLLRNLWPPV